MRLNPFGGRGARRQTPAQVRRERDRLVADNTALADELVAAGHVIANLTEDCDWFHDHWVQVGHRAMDAELVAAHLEQMLAEANRKVTDLEAIAGPHVDSRTAPEPLYAAVAERRDGEITREFRALPAGPVSTPGPLPVPEPIGPMTLVKPLVRAAGGAL